MQTLKHILSTPIALTIIWLASLIYVQLIPETITKEKDKIWHPYTEENITASLQNNEAVFINFTAKWCLTCQLNDKTIFSTKRFKQYIKDNNIKLYKADWTTKDNLIKQALATYNRHSVPLYIYYKKGSTSPKILPTVLTLDSLINYLN